MFDGSSEQFHQFIASSSSTSLPFPLHISPSFDPYAPPLHHHPPPPPPPPSKVTENPIPWSNDELLSLLKLRSSMEIWFPDFTWEHVSRKLGELGFKRSAEQCKEKFEEESRNFNNSKSYRMMSELDEFCHGSEDQEREIEKPEEDPKRVEEEEEEEVGKKSKESKKRKRRDKFEKFKGFCEAVVKKMMAKQEQLHNKLIQDILKRDEEKIAREEAWKNQEIERFTTQIENRSNDQKSAAERQSAIIEFLTHFSSHIDNQPIHKKQQEKEQLQQQQEEQEQEDEEEEEVNNSNSSSSIPPPQNNPNTSPTSIAAAASDPPPPPSGGDDVGKRWPRDEVLALINLRCRMSGEQEMSKEKGPLWERISQGMREMGYKRSAKRCKEKWENINKYFRKTKDSSKKRSVNSRTCPYFQQLSSLYGDGTIVAPTAAAAAAPENEGVDLGGERGAVDVDGGF